MTQPPPPPPSTWSKVLGEINARGQAGDPAAFDTIRLQKLQRVCLVTGRPLIVYAVACTLPNKIVPAQTLQMDFSDKLAFHDVTEHLDHDGVDVLLHSPGGLAEAAEAIVDILRNRFSHVRFIIPTFAKSAATMLALSGDEILMSDQAELGPTDPQMITASGVSPAQAVIDQFEKARAEIAANPAGLPAWAPILAQMGPSLLQQCQNAIDLSRELVKKWLTTYMFKDAEGAEAKADNIAEYLANHNNFKSHARGVRLPLLQELEVHASAVPQELVDPIWEAYCAIDITLGNSTAVRLIENNIGNRMIRNYGQVSLPIPFIQPMPPPGAPQPGQPGAP